MSDLTFGVKLDGSGNLVGAAKDARAEIDNLKKSTDELGASSQRTKSQAEQLNNSYSSQALKMRETHEAQMGMSISASDAKDKAWALVNGYKEVGGQFTKAAAAADEAAHANAGVTRELMVLGHEAMTGNFSRMPGTLAVLASRAGMTGAEMVGLGLTIALPVAALGGLALAIHAGAKEMEAMDNALAVTSNYAGLTRGGMESLAQSMAQSGQMTIGTSKEIVTALVSSGQIGAQSISAVASLAGDFARATGADIDKIAPEMVKLFSDPLKGAEELNKSMHFLTATDMEHIATLERLGETQQAQLYLAETVTDHMPKETENVGTLTEAYRGLKNALSDVLDNMESLGKTPDIGNRIDDALKNLSFMQTMHLPQETIDRQEALIRFLDSEYTATNKVSDAQAKQAEDNKKENLAFEYARQNSELQKKSELMDKITQMSAVYANRQTDSTDLAYQKQSMVLWEGIAKAKADLAKIGIVKDPNESAVIAMQTELFKKQMEALGVAPEQIKVYELAMKGATTADINAAQAAANGSIALDAKAQATKDAAEAAKAYIATKTQVEDQGKKEIEALDKTIAAQQLHNAEIGKTPEQIALVKAAVYDLATAQVQADADALRSAADFAGADRDIYLARAATLDHEIEQRKTIAGLMGNAAVLESSAAATKNYAEEFNKASTSINHSLTDALLRAFESGKGYAEAFLSTLVNMFKTLVLQPTISYILTPMTGGMAAMMSGTSEIAGSQGQPNPATDPSMALADGSTAGGAALSAGWIGLAVVAAVSIIKSMGYDHGNKSAAEIQSVQATGEVFGNISAKSATIAAVSQAIKLNSDEGLVYSKGMLDALTQMNNGINSFASMIVRTNPNLTTGAGMGILTGQISASHIHNPAFDSQGNGQILSEFFPKIIAGMNKWVDSHDAVQGLINSFSKTTQEITDVGLKIKGTVADLMQGSGVRQYADSNTTTSSYWGLSKSTDANPTQYANVTSDVAKTFGRIFTSLHDVMVNASAVLGRDTSGIATLIDNFDVSTSISLKGLKGTALSDAISQKITNMTDKMVTAMFGDVLKYSNIGEDALTTLVRVANETETVSIALNRIGVASKPAATEMMGVAESLIAAAGGADSYTSKMAFFTKNFLTSSQQLVPIQAAVNKTFADLNHTVPTTRAEFTALMQAQNVATASGQAFHVALLDIAPAFDQVMTSVEQATQASIAAAQQSAQDSIALAKQRSGMEIQLMTAQGNAAGALAQTRRDEIAALDATLQPLQQSIYAAQDKATADQAAATAATAAATAAQQLTAAWQSGTDSIFSEIKRIRGLTGPGAQSLAGAQSQFAIATAQARSGNLDAYKLLPGLSQALTTIAASTATTALGLARIQNQTASSLTTTGNILAAKYGTTLPSFAVGTNYLPSDMTLNAHAGERIIPAADNKELMARLRDPNKGNGALLDEIKALRAEVTNSRSDNKSAQAALAYNTNRTAKFVELMDRWNVNGMPPVRAV